MKQTSHTRTARQAAGQRTAVKHYNQLAKRLTVAVSTKLGFQAEFSHWQPNSNGSETPVFIVPASTVEMAQRLGLTVVAR